MVDAVAALSAAATSWLLTYLLHSSVLLGGTWVVVRVFALEARSRDFLWRVALLGGLATASGSVWSASPEPRRIDVVRRDAVEEVRRLHWVEGRRSVDVRVDVTGPSAGCRAVLREPDFEAPGWLDRLRGACSHRAGPDWYLALVVVWLAGMALGVAVLVTRRSGLADLRASLGPAGPRAQRAFRNVAWGRGVDVRCSALLAAPCVLSSRTIGLPERCEEELTDAELRAVLAHELAHATRADVAWSWLLHGVGALGWMQPLNRVGMRAALEAAEEVCDDWALARTGERRGLATSISRVAEWVAVAPHRPAPVSMAGREPGPASSRVRRILHGPSRPEPAWLKVVSVALVTAPLFWLPTVDAPRRSQASLVVAERVVVGEAPDTLPSGLTAVRHAVFVTRLRGR
jgi:hypothetical protein